MKQMGLFLSGLVFTLAIYGVSFAGENTVLATYNNGVSNRSVTIGDVKKELLDYVVYRPDIINDFDWHRDYLFRRHIALPAVYFDQVSKGLTNRPEYRAEYERQYWKQYYFSLYRAAREAIEKEAQDNKYPVAHVAHILFAVSRQTNDGENDREMTDAEYAALLADKEAAAKNLIESLLVSKNQLRDFSNAAISFSEDPDSKYRGGDVGYISSDMMVREFEDAVFAATRKGLIAAPVKTDYGIHVLFVIEPKKEMTLSQLKGKVNQEEFARLEKSLLASYYKKVNETEVKEEYTLVSSNHTLVAQGVSYPLNTIADNAVIYTIYGKPFTWRDSVAILKVMVPSMLNTNITYDEFQTQMSKLKQFVPLIRYAEMKKLQNSSAFKKEIAEMGEKTAQQVAATYMDLEMQHAVQEKITPEMVRMFYEANREQFMVERRSTEEPGSDGEGSEEYTEPSEREMVQQTLTEAEPKIREQLQTRMDDEYVHTWIGEMQVRMNVQYSEPGLRELMEMEKKQLQALEERRRSEQSRHGDEE